MTTSGLDLELRERNDEVVTANVTNPDGTPVDLTGHTVEAILKPKAATPDADGLTLSTTAGEITIDDPTTGAVRIAISSDQLTVPGQRFWRLDVLDPDGRRRTCGYGRITIIDL